MTRKALRQKLTPTEELFDVRSLRCLVRIDGKGCWVWIGRLNERGYGKCERRWNGRLYVRAHRLAYAVLVGAIPRGLTIEHRCRNRACVNPEHLEPMTLKQNLKRRIFGARDERQQILFT